MPLFTVEKLNAAMDAVRALPALTPRDGKTFCNMGAFALASELEVPWIWGTLKEGFVTATDMINFMDNTPEIFCPLFPGGGLKAWEAGKEGVLVFAAALDSPHSHIAPVYPSLAPMTSGRWGCMVPYVSNVGKENAVMGANYAFSKDRRPVYYAVVAA